MSIVLIYDNLIFVIENYVLYGTVLYWTVLLFILLNCINVCNEHLVELVCFAKLYTTFQLSALEAKYNTMPSLSGATA